MKINANATYHFGINYVGFSDFVFSDMKSFLMMNSDLIKKH